MKPVISEDLKKHMTVSPGKKVVWLNDAGEWSNHKDAKYPHEVKREEILGKEKEVKKDAASGSAAASSAASTEKNTKDPKIKVEVTAANKKEIAKIVPGVKAGDIVEIDNPDYVDPLA